jgi:hypothetical protein
MWLLEARECQANHKQSNWRDCQRVSLGKCALHGRGLAFDHPQKSSGRAVGSATPLFPILKRVEFETEPSGKVGLRKTEARAYGADVHLVGHMRDKPLTRAAGVGERLTRTAKNAPSGLAHHPILLRYVGAYVRHWRIDFKRAKPRLPHRRRATTR